MPQGGGEKQKPSSCHHYFHRSQSRKVHSGRGPADEELDRERRFAQERPEPIHPGTELGAFAQQLEYKAESAGGQLVKVDPKNTTQKCSSCGGMPRVKLTLKDRWHYCAHCGHSEDRDVNASKNILLEGLRLFDSGGIFPEVLAEGRTTDSVANRQHGNIVN